MINPNPAVWNDIGVAQSALGWYGEALDSYNQSLDIDPDYSDAWGNIGLVLKEMGRMDEADRAFKRAGEDCPACADG